MTVWQVSSGPGNRTYGDVFLRYGVALIGPGYLGAWDAERYQHVTGSDKRFVRQVATAMKEGDAVILRAGLSRIAAVGIVTGSYEFLDAFDDVNGWDLQHARRVRWCPLPTPHDFGSSVFGANPPRISRVSQAEIVDYVKRFVASPPTYWQTEVLPALPAAEPPLDGVPAELRSVVAEAQDLCGLWWDRVRFGEHPVEDEAIVHVVVPLLRALGWPPECIGVKWRRIDVAVFNALPRTPENCRLVIEAKRLGAGVEGALGQAQRYVAGLERSCDVLVTDGMRYRLYDGQREHAPVAYANLVRLKASAVELFNRIRRV